MASLLKRSFDSHSVAITVNLKEELTRHPPAVQKAFYKNFIEIINNGYEPHELPGKYKPSWQASYATNAMLDAILQACVDNQAHHYHFGYECYTNGADREFAGLVSPGIIHTRLECDGKNLWHTVFAIHTSHPKPFYCPIFSINDPI